jgi:2-C-methyl-D-erythritol 2,4-cyclodiphosphate synthase
MRQRLAEALGIDMEQISIKATTNEGMDAIGQKEAIAVHAVVLLVKG